MTVTSERLASHERNRRAFDHMNSEERQRAEGKYALMVDGAFAGFFTTNRDALREALKNGHENVFSVIAVRAGPEHAGFYGYGDAARKA